MAIELHQPEAVRFEPGMAGTWQIDGAHTEVSFVARHMMVTKVRGRFTDVTGTVQVGERVEGSRVDVRIDASSIDTGAPMRDQHLRSPDFLDVERFPALTFRSTGIEVTGERTMRIRGDLTIRDVTRPVELEAAFEGLVPDPKGSRATFSASTEIDREDWGMTWNVALETGGWLVSKKVRIELEVALVTAAAERAA